MCTFGWHDLSSREKSQTTRRHAIPIARSDRRGNYAIKTTKTRKVGRENPNVVLYYQIFVNHTHETKSKYREESVIIPYEIGQNINNVT